MEMRRFSGFVVRFLLLSLIVSLSLLGLAQQEDVDTDTAILILNIERALSIEVLGGPLVITVDAAALEERVIPLEGLQVSVDSLIDYQVDAYGAVSPGTIDLGTLQLRVEGIVGPFEEILTPEFAPLGPPERPLPLFTGGNNIGLGTVATIGLRLDLGRLTGPLADRYTWTISFTAVER